MCLPPCLSPQGKWWCNPSACVVVQSSGWQWGAPDFSKPHLLHSPCQWSVIESTLFSILNNISAPQLLILCIMDQNFLIVKAVSSWKRLLQKGFAPTLEKHAASFILKLVKSTCFNIFSYVITCMDNYFELVTNSSECFFLRFLLPPNGLYWYLLIQGFLTWHLILSIKLSFVSTVSGVVCKRALFVRSLTRCIDRQRWRLSWRQVISQAQDIHDLWCQLLAQQDAAAAYW